MAEESSSFRAKQRQQDAAHRRKVTNDTRIDMTLFAEFDSDGKRSTCRLTFTAFC